MKPDAANAALVRGAAREFSSPRVFGLDALRAAAILFVLCGHASVVLWQHVSPWFHLCDHGGFYGVELFFVLSGFLIGGILLEAADQLRRPGEVTRFYIRRWFRTLPLFALLLLVNVWLELGLRQHSLGLREVLEHAFFLRNFSGAGLSFFLESWSLAVEEWFYLLFPAVLWLALQFTRSFDRAFLSVAAAFFLFSTFGRVVSAMHPAANWTDHQRQIVLFRFDAIMTGIIAAWIARRFPNHWRKCGRIAATIGLVILMIVYVSLWTVRQGIPEPSADTFFARTFRFNLVSLAFALLLPLASTLVVQENFGTASIRRIALWSYSLYLVQLPAIFLLMCYTAVGTWTSPALALVAFVLELIVAISLSALFYHGFEARCTKLRDRFAPAHGRGKRPRPETSR